MAVTITDEQIQAMADAIMSGELRVTMPNGSAVQYRSTAELMQAYNWALNQQAKASGVDNRRAKARFM